MQSTTEKTHAENSELYLKTLQFPEKVSPCLLIPGEAAHHNEMIAPTVEIKDF
jgi:hypothetical protein